MPFSKLAANMRFHYYLPNLRPTCATTSPQLAADTRRHHLPSSPPICAENIFLAPRCPRPTCANTIFQAHGQHALACSATLFYAECRVHVELADSSLQLLSSWTSRKRSRSFCDSQELLSLSTLHRVQIPAPTSPALLSTRDPNPHNSFPKIAHLLRRRPLLLPAPDNFPLTFWEATRPEPRPPGQPHPHSGVAPSGSSSAAAFSNIQTHASTPPLSTSGAPFLRSTTTSSSPSGHTDGPLRYPVATGDPARTTLLKAAPLFHLPAHMRALALAHVQAPTPAPIFGPCSTPPSALDPFIGARPSAGSPRGRRSPGSSPTIGPRPSSDPVKPTPLPPLPFGGSPVLPRGVILALYPPATR